jgi:hypothetical protein
VETWHYVVIIGSVALGLIVLYLLIFSKRMSIIPYQLRSLLGDSSPVYESPDGKYFARLQNTKSEPAFFKTKGNAEIVKTHLNNSGHSARIVKAGSGGYYIYSRPKDSMYRYPEPVQVKKAGKTGITIKLPHSGNPSDVPESEVIVKDAKILERI